MSNDWIWIATDVAMAAHAEQLAEHGGGEGVRDERLLDSAMARPKNLAAYGEPDAAALAASYAFGIARNHPVIDGNKRMAAVVSEAFLNLNGSVLSATDAEVVVAFLALNGHDLRFAPEDAIRTVLALAAGELTEEELADWFRTRIACP